MRIVLLGPPGSGKGTQAALLKDRIKVPHISTGDLLRSAVADETPLGRQARSFMDRGELVPDELVLGLIEERLGAADVQPGFILDGYPRNLAQARALDELLERLEQPVEKALELRVDEEQIIQRLARRAEEEGRSDDTEEVVRNRLKVYREQTAPVSEHYREHGLLAEIDGIGSIEDINQRLADALG
ncbi:adenylate kinase [Wenzhouxiangella sp. AB-CW3]|uniref:adenylate kinase n=1 Tax=Wenzhouxiangella sp. AB-CW3 TaxID=2771012 RepID=UPI00168A8068|nr:adenylate kinase [Wenzhouxiangella sp. AB-CW3]QOC22826.1 adenylate kinase [Wenzhouxiangella sp. AB-CW3]